MIVFQWHRNLRLGLTLAAAAISLAVGAGTAASRDSGSALSIGPEEQSIYEAVIDAWLGPRPVNQLVNERLAAAPSPTENARCVKGLNFQPDANGARSAKSLSGVTFKRAGLTLIDGETWSADDRALQDSVRGGTLRPPDLDRAFSHSLFTLSQIAFSTNGKDALVSYSNVCGRLCGTGSVLVMHKAAGRWKIVRRCGGWIS